MDEEAPQPEYSEDGVDLSLIRWFLSLTPAERLQVFEDHTRELELLIGLNANK